MASDSAVRFDAATAVLRGQVRPAVVNGASPDRNVEPYHLPT